GRTQSHHRGIEARQSKTISIETLWRLPRSVVCRLPRVVVCRRGGLWRRLSGSTLARRASRTGEGDALALTRRLCDPHPDRPIGAVMGLICRSIADDVLGAQVADDFAGDLREFGD